MYKKLLEIQKEIGTVKKDSVNPFLKNKYVDINSLLEQVKPLFDKYGLGLFQPLSNVNGRPALRTIVTDNDKEIINDVITLPDLQDSQKMGGAITYYRRYSILSLLGLGAEDDDGNYASKPTIKEKAKQAVKVAESEEDIGF
jgi:hypothetical protein